MAATSGGMTPRELSVHPTHAIREKFYLNTYRSSIRILPVFCRNSRLTHRRFFQDVLDRRVLTTYSLVILRPAARCRAM